MWYIQTEIQSIKFDQTRYKGKSSSMQLRYFVPNTWNNNSKNVYNSTSNKTYLCRGWMDSYLPIIRAVRL